MKMWVSDRLWEDILAMIKKLWSSSRGKRRNQTVLEVDEEEDEVLGGKEDVKLSTRNTMEALALSSTPKAEEAAAETRKRDAAPTALLFASHTRHTEMKHSTVS